MALATWIGPACAHAGLPVVQPASGVLLAAFLLYGTRHWLAVAALASCVSLATRVLSDLGALSPSTWPGQVGTEVAGAAFGVLGPVAGAALVRFYLGDREGRVKLETLRELFALVACACTLGAAIAALGGPLGASEAADPGRLAGWLRAWAAHALGMLTIGPLLLFVLAGRTSSAEAPDRSLYESSAYVVAVLCLGSIVLAAGPTSIWNLALTTVALLPVLLWAALRFTPAILAITSTYLGAVGLVELRAGNGPFAAASRVPGDEILAFQVYVGGTFGCLLALALALVALRRAQAARLAAEAHLAEAQKLELLGRLATGMAHDFANFLVSIHGYADILRSELADDRELEHFAAQILRAGDGANAIVQRFLAFGRRRTPELEIVDVLAHVTELRPILATTVGKSVELDVQVRGEGPFTILIEPAQLDQVLLNLALNARDAMPSGGRMSIVVARESEPPQAEDRPSAPDRVELLVGDTGIGMDAATRQHACDPFFTTKPGGQGTGVGLATVADVLADSHGTLGVESELGRGTTFRLSWPAGEDRDHDDLGKPPPAPGLQGRETDSSRVESART